MDTDHPFYAWSLAEATHWLIHLPFLGIIALVLLGAIVTLLVLALLAASPG
jgi:hypothetical protein